MNHPHGTRAAYKGGCHCLPCRAAEAAYRGHLRGLHRRQKRPLGSIISAKETHRKIHALLVERFTKAELARQLGLKRGRLEVHPHLVRVKTALRMQRLWRHYMTGEGPDAPIGDPPNV